MSYDVSALFTSIPIDPAIKIIKKHLDEDQDLSKRTSMTVNHIICLLEFCLRNTYFSFQGRSNVTPSLLDGGRQIILANWPNYKRIICTYNNNIPVNIPGHTYVLLDRNILCNCDIEAESNFLLKLLATCEEQQKPDLEMYFTMNLAFVDYLEQLNETITTP